MYRVEFDGTPDVKITKGIAEGRGACLALVSSRCGRSGRRDVCQSVHDRCAAQRVAWLMTG